MTTTKTPQLYTCASHSAKRCDSPMIQVLGGQGTARRCQSHKNAWWGKDKWRVTQPSEIIQLTHGRIMLRCILPYPAAIDLLPNQMMQCTAAAQIPMNGLYSSKLASVLPTGSAHNPQSFFWPRVGPHSRLSRSHVLGIACLSGAKVLLWQWPLGATKMSQLRVSS